MLPELTIIRWRGIPAQVIARDGERCARRELSERFQRAIDAAAMKAGLVGIDAYLEEWRQDTRLCSADLERETARQAEQIEAEFDDDVLRALVSSAGRSGTPLGDDLEASMFPIEAGAKFWEAHVQETSTVRRLGWSSE